MTNREEFEKWYVGEGITCLPEEISKMWDSWKASRRWIPVSERLPENGEQVIGLDGGSTGPFIVRRNNNDWWDEQGYLRGVKYWQPLPPLPEVNNGN